MTEMNQIDVTHPDRSPLPDQLIAKLRAVPLLASLSAEQLHCLDGARHFTAAPGTVLIQQGDSTRRFWFLLGGRLQLSIDNHTGHEQVVHVLEAGASFGETQLLANIPSVTSFQALDECDLLEMTEEQFWVMMTACPEVRKGVLGNMAQRLHKMQAVVFQQQKMASLGTLAAGLMHELNNPGSAARRASVQLRENLTRMHDLTAKFSREPMRDDQRQCIFKLQEYALHARPAVALTTLEQTDAEEALTKWLEAAHVQDAWKLAPTLVEIGFDAPTLECARSSFEGAAFTDALKWLEALASSMQLVGTIEESIGRVTDLVQAVKSYAYEGRGQQQEININQSIHATLVILGHKLREKQVVLDKHLAAELPHFHTQCQGLNQVWTNILDNAIDAVAQHGTISIKTWAEAVAASSNMPREELCILIRDNGEGIPQESQEHIFDPFYTTKPVGVGTGLGLGIVHRIVEECGGVIHFNSSAKGTEFIVRLPNPAVLT